MGMDRTDAGRCFLTPLGIPTVIIADDPQLLAAARDAYAAWSAPAPTAGPALQIELSGGARATPIGFGITVEGSRLSIAGDGFDGWANCETGEGRARVPPRMADDPRALAAELIDPLLLFLATRRDRTPVHAAAFMVGDTAILLSGPSGSGKSSLALAASRRGLPLLSDDMVFVQLSPSLRIWGFPRPIHLFERDAPAGRHPVRVQNGKRKVAVEPGAVALSADRFLLVLIERGGALDLGPMAREEARTRLLRLDPGFDLLEKESIAAIEVLTDRDPWRLTLGRDPDEALDSLIARLEPDERPGRQG